MEIEAFIKKMKDINSVLIDFIDETEGHDTEFETLIEIFEDQKILESKDEVRLLFQLLSKIADNHCRSSIFFNKLEKIFQYLIKDIPSTISYFIPDYTKFNRAILFLLLDKGFVIPDETFLNQYLRSKASKKEADMSQTYYYLYPKLKKFLEEKTQKQIEEEIIEKYSESISTFEEKCQIGENDSYICSLIRSDSVEEFISYVNRTNLSLLTKIQPSIYETNSFLIDKNPTLIEYAAFYGSIQIIQYLKYNKIPLPSSLWIYAVHSNNAELIHFIEENADKPERIVSSYSFFKNYYQQSKTKKESYDKVIIESIKCHHNAISDYIKDNLCNQIQTGDQTHFYDNFCDTIIESFNFFFFPNEIISMICEPRKVKGFNLSRIFFSLTNITIPSSVTSIGDYAFEGCSSLTQVSIPSSVKSIGSDAFSGCSSLTQISIPSSVTSFGDYIFDGIKSLEITGDINHIPNRLFSKCSSLAQIIIPSSVTSIGKYAFYKCSSLTQMAIPSSVTSIDDYSFKECSSLVHISIPSSVTSIGKGLFSKCSSLKRITIPSSVTSIDDYAFRGCSSLTQITIPSSVKSIGNSSLLGCSSLTQITIPSSVTEIGDSAFSGCSSLTQITIHSSITTIGNFTFSECSSLTQMVIPSSVTSIGNFAFSECSSLNQIVIPSSVTSIGNNAFSGCSLLSFESSNNKTAPKSRKNSNNRSTWKIFTTSNRSPLMHNSIINTNTSDNNNNNNTNKPSWGINGNKTYQWQTNNTKKSTWTGSNANTKFVWKTNIDNTNKK